MRPSSLPHRKPATKGRREPAPPPPGPTPEQLEIKALREENERLRAAEADAGEGLAAAKEELDEVGKREAALADLLASAGCDTLSGSGYEGQLDRPRHARPCMIRNFIVF